MASLKQIAFAGDSIAQGFDAFDFGSGGRGIWIELVAERLGNIPGLGPLLGPGFRGIWRDNGVLGSSGATVEWTNAGTWTQTATTDVFDRGWGGYSFWANSGTSATRTWTIPPNWRAISGFCVYWIDFAQGGNWQYSIDGGTWTNMGQSLAHDNGLKKFYINTAVTTTVSFRAHSGASAVGICLAGIEPFFQDPTSVSGLIVHNMAISGINLDDITLNTSGDRLAWLDSVGLGTGSPPINQPTIVSAGTYSNDVVNINNTTTWANDLLTFGKRVLPFASLGFINCYEQGSGRNTTTQSNYRSTLKTTAGRLSASIPVLDLRDQWAQLGFPAFTDGQISGFLEAGNIHPTQIGHINIQELVFQWVRTKLLSYQNLDDPFTVASSQVGSGDTLGGNTTIQVDREPAIYQDATGIKVV